MNMQSLGAFLQCHKNPMATYKCLESFRKFYSDSTIVLLSDNGYDYTEMAKLFKCIYIHETENLWLTYKDLDSGEHINNSNKLITRIYNAFKLVKEDYVMWLEDDVSINHIIRDQFRYDINGYCPNNIHPNSNIELKGKYPFIENNRLYKMSGHGGSVFHKNNILSYFENNDIIQDILVNWKNYKFPSDLGQDFLFSVIVTLNKGSVGPYHGHYDGFNEINNHIIVQHQYKLWYGQPLPDELKYLVK